MTLHAEPLSAAEEAERSEPASSNGHHPTARPRPALSVIVPTRNEAEQHPAAAGRTRGGAAERLEIIFVDDSDDNTREMVEAERARRSALDRPDPPREASDRVDGLSGRSCPRPADRPRGRLGVRDGCRPPAPAGGSFPTCSRARRQAESTWSSPAGTAGWRARTSAPVERSCRSPRRMPRESCSRARLRGVSDPMSGFFLVRRSSVPLDRLRPARLQDPARDPRPRAEAPRRRGAVRVRRPARWREQGVARRGRPLPSPARRAARRAGTWSGSSLSALPAWPSTWLAFALFANVADAELPARRRARHAVLDDLELRASRSGGSSATGASA